MAQELTGRQIMDKVAEIHDRPYEYEKQTMTLEDLRSGGTEVREVRRYARDDGNGEKKYLVAFHDPKGVRGVALLTWQFDAKEDDQFLYLPSQGKRMKRIAKGGKRNYFMGTDLTFEDLISESRDKFDYQRQPDEERHGEMVFVVDAYPLADDIKRTTGYKYRRLYILQETFFMKETEYFDRRGRYIKRQVSSELEPIGDGALRARVQRIENERNNHATNIVVEERTFDEAMVDSGKFRQRFITSGRHVR
jgi:hypothetical protein